MHVRVQVTVQVKMGTEKRNRSGEQRTGGHGRD